MVPAVCWTRRAAVFSAIRALDRAGNLRVEGLTRHSKVRAAAADGLVARFGAQESLLVASKKNTDRERIRE